MGGIIPCNACITSVRTRALHMYCTKQYRSVDNIVLWRIIHAGISRHSDSDSWRPPSFGSIFARRWTMF